jgi:hypothetical protein
MEVKMNFNHIRALYIAGFQMWLNDKRSIAMRLVVWPNVIPLIFIGFFAIAVTFMAVRTSSPNGDMSSAGGVTYTIEGTDLTGEISTLLSTYPTNFVYVPLDSGDTLEEKISSGDITFGLSFVRDNSGKTTISLKYDRQRSYPHKVWIEQTKDRLAEVALVIRTHRLKEQGFESSELTSVLAPIDFEIDGYGGNTSSMFLSAIAFLLWSALIIIPLDACASITSTQMLQDNKGFLSTWKCAGVKKFDVILSRIMVSASVFIISLFMLALSIFTWVNLYLVLLDFVIPNLPQEQLNSPKLYMLTLGFYEFISSLQLGQLLLALTVVVSVSILLLALRLKFTLYASDFEQVRTKLKGIEFALFNVPIIGFLAGGFVVSYTTMSIPILNGLISITQSLKSELTLGPIVIAVMVNLSITCLVFMSVNRHIDSEQRLLNCS